MAGSQGATPKYRDINGFKICETFSEENFLSALSYKPRDDDMFVVTFPKCGTTWTQTIIFLILNKGKPFGNLMEFMVRTPFLEITGAEGAETMPRPGIIKLHLPFNLTPFNPKAKYIYVSRNPKDTCVSFYHHTFGLCDYGFDGTFSDYFEIFYNGQNDFGEYFEHTLSWYDHRNDDNVLFLTYEEMKQDTRKAVMKIARFLGEQWEKMLLDEPEIVEKVLKYSSLEEMKKIMQVGNIAKQESEKDQLPNDLKMPKALEKMKTKEIKIKPNYEFVRKGVIGDWQNYFSEDQAKRMDERTKEKLAGTELLEYWKSLGIIV